MTKKEDEKENDNDPQRQVLVRNGRTVVKTTVEIDRDLYQKLREEAIKRHQTLREVINEAIREALGGGQGTMEREELETLKMLLPHNDLALQIVEILEKTMPRTTALVVFNEKCKRHGLDPKALKAKEVPIHFIEDLSLSARFAAGIEAGRLVHSAMMRLIKGVDEERDARDTGAKSEEKKEG